MCNLFVFDLEMLLVLRFHYFPAINRPIFRWHENQWDQCVHTNTRAIKLMNIVYVPTATIRYVDPIIIILGQIGAFVVFLFTNICPFVFSLTYTAQPESPTTMMDTRVKSDGKSSVASVELVVWASAIWGPHIHREGLHLLLVEDHSSVRRLLSEQGS